MNHVVELPIHELKQALTGLSKVVPKRASLPVLSHIRVKRAGEQVTLQATNLDTTVTFQHQSDGPVCDFLVPFEPLLKLVKGSKEPVVLMAEAKATVRFKTIVGNSPLEQSYPTLPVAEFPAAPNIESKAITVDGAFRDRLREALDCCSADSSRHILQHVCLDTRYPDGHYLIATDGRHLFSANSFNFDLKEPVLVPDISFLRWNGFMAEGKGELAVQPTEKDGAPWVCIQSAPWTVITRSAVGNYPNWKQVVPNDDDKRTNIVLEEAAVKTLLSALPKLPGNEDQDHPIRLEVRESNLFVKANSKAVPEWTTLKVEPVQINGPAAEITLNRDYVLKALRFGLNTLAIMDPLSPVLFSEAGRRMVIMPLRTSAVPPKPSQPSTLPAEAKQPAQPQPNPMPKTAEANPPNHETTPESPLKSVLTHIDQIKETLKNVLRDLVATADLLKQMEKERKASDKEVEAVREKLREIQSVRI